jgi:hypothetical protein
MASRTVLLVALLFLAGCNGGTVARHALTNDKKTLDSIACEGALVAAGVARDRTTVFYAREQAEELRIQASNLADALASRKTVQSIEHQVREASGQAARLAGVLQRLTGLVTGTPGLLEHLGIVSRTRTPIPWSDVVRIEGKQIVVREQRR